MVNFKKRYVIGEGYPVIYSDDGVYVSSSRKEEIFKRVKKPQELYRLDCPKYRLVFEKVD